MIAAIVALRRASAAFALTAIAYAAPALKPIWVALGDPSGEPGQDRSIASVECAEFSPDGQFVVSGAKRWAAVTLFRASDGSRVWQHPRDDEVEVVAFSRDGRFIAAAGEDKRVEILEPRDGSVVQVLTLPASADGMRFTHDGALLAIGDEAQGITLLRTSDWRQLSRTIHGGTGENAVNSIDFSRDDRLVATAGTNREVRLWDLDKASGKLTARRTLSHGGSVKSVRLSRDGTLVAAGAGSGAGVKVWNVADGGLVAHIPAVTPARMPKPVTTEAVEWTPDGAYLVTGGDEGQKVGGAEDGIGTIRVYATADLRAGRTEPVHAQRVFRQEYFHFAPDGRRMLSAHEDGTVRLWEFVR